MSKQISNIEYVKENLTQVTIMIGNEDGGDEGVEIMWHLDSKTGFIDYHITEELQATLRALMMPHVKKLIQEMEQSEYVFKPRKTDEVA